MWKITLSCNLFNAKFEDFCKSVWNIYFMRDIPNCLNMIKEPGNFPRQMVKFEHTNTQTLCRFLLGANDAVHKHMKSQPRMRQLSSGGSFVCLINWTRISSRSSILSIPCRITVCISAAAESSFTSSFIHFVKSCSDIDNSLTVSIHLTLTMLNF